MKGAIPWPRFTPVSDAALLVSFADAITDEAGEAVLALDAELSRSPPVGFVESVPAYVSLLIGFDPLATDHREVEVTTRSILECTASRRGSPQADVRRHEVEVCYEAGFSPDLEAVALASNLSPEQVIDCHLRGDYQIRMYGFAPGYAYMAGVPQSIHVPRKQAAVRDVPAGSVVIAGPQCLVTTLTMPTGWSIIGRSPAQILRRDDASPFLFGVGDRVTFKRIDLATYEARAKAAGHA